ncbi:hypothetical protein KY289_026647 [Solanum tuberosum]|nr:hypothetical protein KY289_026647 [Solanum tuberosum]
MSIGIVIGLVSKCRTQKVKQAKDKTHLPAIKSSSKDISVADGTTMAQKTSSKGNFTNDRNMKELASTSAMRNQREPTKKQTSPWISTKTVHHEPTSEADTQVNKPSIAQGVVEMYNTSHRMEVGPAECSLRSFLTQTRTLQFDKSQQANEDASIEIRGNMNSRTLRDASTSSPLIVYERRGKRKSHHMEAPKEKNDEIVQPDVGNLESPIVEMTEQLRNLQEHIDQHILL